MKQIGLRPCPRSGISAVVVPSTNRVIFFGGVQDVEDESDDSDDEDEELGNFFNDLYSVNVENERATWAKLEITGKKDPAKKKTKQEEPEGSKEGQDAEENSGTTKVVEDGAFTITSTVGIETNAKEEAADDPLASKFSQMQIFKGPSPRFGSLMAIKQGALYLFGGMVEDSNDRQLTHKDFYSLGEHLKRENSRVILIEPSCLFQIFTSWTNGRSSLSPTSRLWNGSTPRTMTLTKMTRRTKKKWIHLSEKGRKNVFHQKFLFLIFFNTLLCSRAALRLRTGGVGPVPTTSIMSEMLLLALFMLEVA